MGGIKIPQQDFALKMQGEGGGGGAYLRDSTVYCTVSSEFVGVIMSLI